MEPEAARDCEASPIRAEVEPRRFYLPQLDGLRFIAFTAVLFYHFTPITLKPKRPFFERNIYIVQTLGWIGVDIFLTLSAFLIITLLLAEKDRTGTIGFRSFYIRRALRIWPLYYAFLVFAFLIPFMDARYDFAGALRDHLGPTMIFLLNFSLMNHVDSMPWSISHLWTISLEEQFYLLAPFAVFFLAYAPARQLACFFIPLFVLAVATRTYDMIAPLPHLIVWYSPFARLDPFLIGCILAIVHHRRPGLLAEFRGEWAALAALVIFLFIAHFPMLRLSLHTIWQLSADAIGCGLLVVAVMGKGRIGRLLARRPLPFLGKISFGLYVYHIVVLHFMNTYVPAFSNPPDKLTWLILLVTTFAITIAMGTASYLLFERHFLKLKRRFEFIHSRPV